MKKNKRPQTPKSENKAWRDARLQHSNMNLTVPAGNRYKRPKAGSRYKDW